ncbi:hypothetical protein FJR48_03405 [Sulfurimonas lithotrophica]|uniref:Uncharacterized protein n=1 Tax=Sulfurimonas lithotrophica TaxID=2590022 RepID=A0A5P8NZP0_9BACT|nr:hypothetical protein [Sulfurimonas lithotrophica]QFR48817.1 hypothetical protein FJR48_03405 [Sulfurimonas lithotrophica]
MSIDKIKRVRILMTYSVGVAYFISMQFLPDPEGNVGTAIQALGVAILIFTLLYGLFSDWMYYKQLIEQGANIEYDTFQKVGIVFNIVALCIITMAVYNELFSGNLNVFSLVIIVPLIYLFLKFIFFKNT